MPLRGSSIVLSPFPGARPRAAAETTLRNVKIFAESELRDSCGNRRFDLSKKYHVSIFPTINGFFRTLSTLFMLQQNIVKLLTYQLSVATSTKDGWIFCPKLIKLTVYIHIHVPI
jgi:hypothetical protein